MKWAFLVFTELIDFFELAVVIVAESRITLERVFAGFSVIVEDFTVR